MLTEDTKTHIEGLLKKYKTRRSAVMPSLMHAQKQNGGNLTEEDMREVAAYLDLNPVVTNEIVGFYTMYNPLKDYGTYHIQVCANLSCSLREAEYIIEHLEKKLEIKSGETTQNKRYTLSRVECLGSCGTAPMMQINDDYYENLTVTRVDEILNNLP